MKLRTLSLAFSSLCLIATFTNCASAPDDYVYDEEKLNKPELTKVIHYIDADNSRSQQLLTGLLNRTPNLNSLNKEYVVLIDSKNNVSLALKNKGYSVILQTSNQYKYAKLQMPFYVVINEKNKSKIVGRYNINPLTKSINFYN